MTTTAGRLALAKLFGLLALTGLAEPAAAQWVQQHEQFYLPAQHNWVFRRTFPQADKLFNAFDYGHAILYERLLTQPDAPASLLEEEDYAFLTRDLLVSPPRLPLEESAIEVKYAQLAPEAKLMFEWAHLLHRQIYDVLGNPRLSRAEQDRAVAELLRYYKSRPEAAFSSLPKSMELMEGQYYSTAFRERYPKFNGLIWAYHWLQVGLYEPLLAGNTVEERQTGVTAAVTRFRQMLENAPENMPRVMPMTAAIAPEFTRRYPEAAIIFDNLHGLHDVISDILASREVPSDRKREEILRAAARYRDDTSYVMTAGEWLEMARMMGVENMGGPVTNLMVAFPEPTVPRGAVLAGADHAAGHGGAANDPHAGHGGAAMPDSGPAVAGADLSLGAERWMEIQARMLADPVIRERVATDPVLRRMLGDAQGGDYPAPVEAPDSARAVDFIVRLLSDPDVEARIHTDPRLHQLWSDPAVQRRLEELRRSETPAAPQPHRH